ncbi:MAG: UDP-4-amino-4, 6-dideoxy-N-acetyl-beta-L-altrosamine transaminase, partial [Acidobacteriota bacterium]|nr:UDP-4-amino-4, 6-dideoxy-N-acetyl-beta-L-altrosamine transaminase [Acidobacteriota bacterium]
MIQYGKHWINQDDINAVTKVLESDFLTQGPEIGAFEKALTDYLGVNYAVVVANGTAALHLAVKALDLENETQGVTAPNTFAASANCFVYNGLEPAFVDIDEKTYCMDPTELEKHITPRTKVVIPVHFAGQPADMERIHNITLKRDIHIIEDASHAIGSRYENGRMVGSCCFADMCIFSFHPVKTIATGEGGAITTNRKDLYDKLILLRNHGITKDPSKFKIDLSNPPNPWYYEMLELGFNYRMTDIQAALGTSQLKRIDSFIQRRREIVARYNEAFKNIPWL